MTIRKQLMRSAMIGHHVKQDKISLKILKKNQKHPMKVSSFLLIIVRACSKRAKERLSFL